MKTVAEIYGRDPKGLEPEEVYSSSNFNQLCSDFDRLLEERDALKAKLEEMTKDGVVVGYRYLAVDGSWRFDKMNHGDVSEAVYSNSLNVAELEKRTARACAKYFKESGVVSSDGSLMKKFEDGKWREYL